MGGLDLVRHLATHPAVGAHRRHVLHWACHGLGRGNGSGGAGLHAFAAGHALAGGGGVVKVKRNVRVAAAPDHAQYVVALFVATRANAARALNAGVKLHV